MSNTKNVYQRIHAVMVEIETLAKSGRNDFHKYNYVTEADYVRALRPLLDKHGLVVIPKIVRESVSVSNDLTTAIVQFTIVDVATGENVMTSVLGQGQDKGDKGAYKLMTGAKKYFAALTFMVATGDDPEKEEAQRRSTNRFNKSKAKPAPAGEDDF